MDVPLLLEVPEKIPQVMQGDVDRRLFGEPQEDADAAVVVLERPRGESLQLCVRHVGVQQLGLRYVTHPHHLKPDAVYSTSP